MNIGNPEELLLRIQTDLFREVRRISSLDSEEFLLELQRDLFRDKNNSIKDSQEFFLKMRKHFFSAIKKNFKNSEERFSGNKPQIAHNFAPIWKMIGSNASDALRSRNRYLSLKPHLATLLSPTSVIT